MIHRAVWVSVAFCFSVVWILFLGSSLEIVIQFPTRDRSALLLALRIQWVIILGSVVLQRVEYIILNTMGFQYPSQALNI
jgi:hypothetical protein